MAISLSTAISAMGAMAILISPAATTRSADQKTDPIEIVTKAGKSYRKLTSLKAQIVRTIKAPGESSTSKGTIYQVGNNRFAMLFSDPPGEAIVANGKYILTYEPQNDPKRVYKSQIPADPVHGINILAKLLDNPKERYGATYLKRDTLSGRDFHVIELVPKADDMPFIKATLWLSLEDDLPRRIVLQQSRLSSQTYDLSELSPNAKIPDSVFKFKIPKGAQVRNSPGVKG
jgi:outer membrane lipoprotein-sorting protein